jgi:hypothetical protein
MIKISQQHSIYTDNLRFSIMVISKMIPKSLLSRQNDILFLASIMAVLGTSAVLLGGIWDSASHALKIPDSFWTIQHVTVYTGVSLVAIASSLGVLLSIKNRKIITGMTTLLVGSLMQLGGGYVDYSFHEKYGIDGLVTSSHLTIESGLVLASLGGFLALAKFGYSKTSKVVPFSIMNLIFSTTWIAFNISLLVGATMLCIPIYDLFSSGCSVM